MNEKTVDIGGKKYALRELTMLESMLADGYVARIAGDGPSTGVMQIKAYALCSVRSIDGVPVSTSNWGNFQGLGQDLKHSQVNALVDAYVEFLPKNESPNDLLAVPAA
jgi:hypothetical protein